MDSFRHGPELLRERDHLRNGLKSIESFVPHVLSEALIIPVHEPVPAKKHNIELPLQVLRRNPAAMVVLNVPCGMN